MTVTLSIDIKGSLLNEFIEIKKSDDTGYIYSTYQRAPTNGDGTGPTLIEKIGSIARTQLEYYKSLLTLSNDKLEQFNRLKNTGRMLTSSDICDFLSTLETPFYAIHNFHIGNLNSMSLKEIKSIIDKYAKDFKLKKLPIVIPIFLRPENIFQTNHIAAIMIKDGQIEYFDPKGIEAKHRNLKEDGTVEDVLKYLDEIFCKKQNEIFQNRMTHQMDINNCGVYVCQFYYDKLVNKEWLGMMPKNRIPRVQILQFRKKMLDLISSQKQLKTDGKKAEKEIKHKIVSEDTVLL